MVTWKSAIYFVLAAVLPAQDTKRDDSAARIAFSNKQAQLVNTLRDAGDYSAAERVLKAWLATDSTDPGERIAIENNLADLLREEGRDKEARHIFDRVLASPDATPLVRLNALIGMADLNMGYGEVQTSIGQWTEAMSMARSQGDVRLEAMSTRGLGRAWFLSGSMARSEPLLRRSLAMLENEKTAHPLQIAVSLSALAEYYRADGKPALAEDAWLHALKIERENLNENHPQVAYTMEMLAQVYASRREFDLACDYAGRAAEMMRQHFGEESPAAATAMANLGAVEQQAKNLGAAAAAFEAATRVLRRSADLWATTKIVMEHYLTVLKELHRNREAKALALEIKGMGPPRSFD